MNGEESSSTPTPVQNAENIRAGYQVAVSLMVYEGGLIWSKYSAMLVANSIVLGVIGVCFGSETAPKLIPAAMAICGLLSCLAWSLLMSRGWEYYKYWLFSARELEELFLREVKTLSRGGVIAEGQTVRLKIGGKDREFHFGKSKVRAQAACYWVIWAFIGLYVGTLAFSVYRQWWPWATS